MNPEFIEIIQTVASKEGIKDATLQLQSLGNRGDGYLGKISFGKIIGSNKSIDVVLKSSHRDKKTMQSTIHKFYLNEIWFYEMIVPAFDRFQANYRIHEPFDSIPTFYGAIKEPNKEVLVLENLKMRNFDMWDRHQIMNEEHIKCALKTFAKFHATVFALEKCEASLYNKVMSGVNSQLRYKVVSGLDIFNQVSYMLIDLLPKLFNKDTEKQYHDKLMTISVTTARDLENIYNYKKHQVILQGDAWVANALYEYNNDDRTSPLSMKLLDFQMMNIGSPILDLSYFLCSAAPKKCIDRLTDYLEYYHDILGEHLAKFGVNVDSFWPFDQFTEQWKHASKYGLFSSIYIKRLMAVQEQDAPDFTEDPVGFIRNLKLSSEAEVKYRQQMKQLFIHFIDNNYV